MRARAGEGWREVRGGLVRGPESSRVDAWARVRPRERDGDRGHAEEQAVAGEGAGGREGAREERRGERREGWTGWIRRLAAIDFSRQTHGLFVPLLVLVLLPSFPPPAFSVPLPPYVTLVPRIRLPRLLRPFRSLARSRSLFALLLVNALPPFDSRSVPFSLPLFLSLFSPCICIRRSSFIVVSLFIFVSRPFSPLLFLSLCVCVVVF